MSDVTIKYKGAAIATMDATGSKTLGTAGKYCEGDIDVEYVKPAAPTGTKQISIAENGTVTEDVAGYANAEITVNVQGGGNQQVEADLISGELTGDYINPLVTEVRVNGFNSVKATTVNLPNCVTIRDSGFRYMPKVTRIYVPKAAGDPYNNYIFGSCPKLELIALPTMTRSLPLAFYGSTRLHTVDLGPNISDIANQTFYGTSLTTLIIRRDSSIMGITTNVFNNSPFASGGAGGTIYIPKSLYDHLGDGTALDYKAAPNWSVIDGYGTITWAPIEGSIYETQYADGTPVT